MPANYKMDEVSRYLSRVFAYDANYELLCGYQNLKTKVFLGSAAKPRTCRFCKRVEPSISFLVKAHAIPVSLGNRLLFSNYECDECNHAFGAGIESDFGAYFNPYRVVGRIRGRKGLPKMKSDSDGWRIEANSRGVHVEVKSNNSIIEHDKTNKRMIFKIKRQPYTPYEVYKCFLRIGLTVMPESELPFFAEHFVWANCTPTNQLLIDPAVVWETFFNGPMTFPGPGIMLWRRRSLNRKIPYLMCILYVANSIFQYFIPSTIKDDNWKKERIKFPLFPAHPTVGRYGVRVEMLDFACMDRVEDDVAEFPFGYEEYSVQNSGS